MNHPEDSVAGERVVYLVEEQSNPSTDCFVLPALSASGYRVLRCRFGDLPARHELAGAAVVFVRYVPRIWAKLIEAVRPHLRSLVFFMDDDVLDVRASAGMPWHYRFKLARLAAARLHWLQRQRAQLWVSTAYLQEKYRNWAPRLVLPSPAPYADETRRVFYHGTASHGAEKRWLRPVAEEALRRDERLVFEIVGGPDVDSLYKGLPRVNVVHQMKWPAYKAFLAMPGRLIGLAPVIGSAFNRARSYTKIFDITRCGAVGIYSSDSACAEMTTHGVDGLVVKLEQDAWVEAILDLVADEPLRRNMLRNAEARLGELAVKAQNSYLPLLAPPQTGADSRTGLGSC